MLQLWNSSKHTFEQRSADEIYYLIWSSGLNTNPFHFFAHVESHVRVSTVLTSKVVVVFA